MLDNNITLNSPIRKIGALVERYQSTDETKTGDIITATGVYPIAEEMNLKIKCKNLANRLTGIRSSGANVTSTVIKETTGSVISSLIEIEEGQTYTLTKENDITGTDSWRYFYFNTYPIYNETVSIGGGYIHQQILEKTITAPADAKYLFVVWSNDNDTYPCGTVQIELGATATAYVPHYDDLTNCGVVVRGKNFFNPATSHTDLNNACGWAIDIWNTGEVANYLKPYTTYTIKYTATSLVDIGKDSGTNESLGFRIYSPTTGNINLGYSGVDVFLTKKGDTITRAHTFTTGVVDDAYLVLYTQAYGGGVYGRFAITDIQIELGDTATSFEPYKEPASYTASADGTVKGAMSISPSMVIMPTVGTQVEASYRLGVCENYAHTDRLISVEIDRAGEDNKFFGFGISQKAKIKVMDKNREIERLEDNCVKISFDGVYPYPSFVTENWERDENTNDLTLTVCDALQAASAHTLAELGLEEGYSPRTMAEACAALIGASGAEFRIDGFEYLADMFYTDGANFNGTENLREVLNDIAEFTQSIYFINKDNKIVFKRLDSAEEASLIIGKTDYFTLKNKNKFTLAALTHATELGDNLTSTTGMDGSNFIIRDNGFYSLREDLPQLLDMAIAAIGGFSNYSFDCSWRGNYLLEIGDKIQLITKDDSTIFSYVLNDKIIYNGGLKEETRWSYEDNEGETSSNPTSLGEAIKLTYAKVDKINKEIEIVASETDANGAELAALRINTDNINATVSKIETETAEAVSQANEDILTLKKSVEAQITAEDVSLAIQSELDNGVSKVITTTGVVVDERGITVDKSNSNTATTISDDGMKVFINENDVVLQADQDGVNAKNLHATTFLTIGTNSRFQNYKNNTRTACFWIGG